MSNRPVFVPKPRPLGKLILFMAAADPVGWGPQQAACHADDLDDLLEIIPAGPVIWHVLDRVAGRITASWSRELEGNQQPVPVEEGLALDEGFLVFEPCEGAWGALHLSRVVHGPDGADPGDLLLEVATSVVTRATSSTPLVVVPALTDLHAYQQQLVEWQVEHGADAAKEEPEPESGADQAVRNFMQLSGLPAGWEDMPIEELRAVVEEIERRAAS